MAAALPAAANPVGICFGLLGLFGRHNRVFYRFRHPKLYNFLRWNLDCFAGRGIAARSCLTVSPNQSTDSGQNEHAVLFCLANSEFSKRLDELLCHSIVDSRRLREFSDDRGLCHAFCFSQLITSQKMKCRRRSLLRNTAVDPAKTRSLQNVLSSSLVNSMIRK